MRRLQIPIHIVWLQKLFRVGVCLLMQGLKFIFQELEDFTFDRRPG